ncbi:hypothetical protein JD793_005132 [Citrobacter braakii]|nr:hypothetical protein [Citrobacter braakii]
MSERMKSQQAPRSGLTVTATQNVAADGHSTSEIQITQSVVHSGAAIALTTSGSAQFTSGGQDATVTANVLGQAVAYLTDTVEETVAVAAFQGTGISGSTTVAFGGGGGTGKPVISSITVIDGSAVADGADPCVVSAVVTDSLTGKPVSGETVYFSVTGGAHASPNPATTDLNGTVAVLITSTVAGPIFVSAGLTDGSQKTTEVTFTDSVNEFSSITTGDGHTFDVDVGFPKTAFAGANFTLVPEDNNPGGYVWSTDHPDVSANEHGVVTITDKCLELVTVTASSRTGEPSLTYTFTPFYWLGSSGSTVMTWAQALQEAEALGARLAPTWLLCNAPANGVRPTRGVGNLWGEWGNMLHYGWHASTPSENSCYHWCLDEEAPTAQYYIDLARGILGSGPLTVNVPAVFLLDSIAE